MPISRSAGLFSVVTIIVGLLFTRGLIAQPGNTDTFYHFNAANRLVSGDGLTDAYLWNYIGAPDSLPAPSHLYWMPLTSLTAAFGMSLLNAPGDYYAAQFPFALMYMATAVVGYWLGRRLGGTVRHAWVAGLLTLFSGFFVRFWGTTDTFAPYALVGSLALVFIGLAMTGNSRRMIVYWLLAGVFAGLGHLTRADGLLLLMVGWLVILWPFGWRQIPAKQRLISFAVLTLAYSLTMLPWFVRSIDVAGSPLPVGGTQSIWFTEYNDLFSYPPDANPQTFFVDGMDLMLSSRWEAFTNNLQTFIAVEGLIILTPLMLVGLWVRRREAFLRGFWLYALGLHVAMTLVFAYPGYRGGLLHSAAALVPFWAALGAVGLDDVIDWVAKRRRSWHPPTAKRVFSVGLVAIGVALSLSIGLGGRVNVGTPALYRALTDVLPADARVMINDPAALYYFTGLGGVVLPNESPDVIPVIARQYDVSYLVIEGVQDDGFIAAAPTPLAFDPDAPPDFLTPIPLNIPRVRLYAIRY